jgi:excinuclease ABC subunit B
MEVTQTVGSSSTRYNNVHGITPTTIVKSVSKKEGAIKGTKHLAKSDVQRQIIEFDAQMREAAEQLDFEKAIKLRDAIKELTKSLTLKIEKEQKHQQNDSNKATKF